MRAITMQPMTNRPREQWDVVAQVFLDGYYYQDDKGGLNRRHYVSRAHQSFEKECRAILAGILMEGNPSRDICRLLAGLIAPDDHESASVRRFEFAQRKRGRKKDMWPIAQIAEIVLATVREGGGVEQGVVAAIDKFSISREYAYDCWKKFKPFYDATGRLPTKKSRVQK